MLINLPFYNAPKQPINLGNFTIRATLGWEEKGSDFPVSVYGFETSKLPMHKKSPAWAMLETPDNLIPSIIYATTLDLLSNHWKYVFKRTVTLARPMTLDRALDFIKVPRYNFTPSLINTFTRAIKFLSKERKARIALQRWSSSYARQDSLDSVLDCCSALEAAMNLPDELRLRISLSAYHLLKRYKKQGFALVYEMYGIRNSFIHGASFPEVDTNKQRSYIDVVAQILRRYIELGKIPSGDEMGKSILHQFSP